MKKKFLAGLLSAAMILPTFNAVVFAEPEETDYVGDVTIANTFTDAKFANYIKYAFDSNSDGVLNKGELDNATDILLSIFSQSMTDYDYAGIESLEGIETLYNLQRFSSNFDSLKSVDLSCNNKLYNVELDGDYTDITLGTQPYLTNLSLCTDTAITVDLSYADVLYDTYQNGVTETYDDGTIWYHLGYNNIYVNSSVTFTPAIVPNSNKITVASCDNNFATTWGTLDTSVETTYVVPDYYSEGYDSWGDYVNSYLGTEGAPDIFVLDEQFSYVLENDNALGFNYLGVNSLDYYEYNYPKQFGYNSNKDGFGIRGFMFEFYPNVLYYNTKLAPADISSELVNWEAYLTVAANEHKNSNGSKRLFNSSFDVSESMLDNSPYTYAINEENKIDLMKMTDYLQSVAPNIGDYTWGAGYFTDDWFKNIQDGKTEAFIGTSWLMDVLTEDYGIAASDWQVLKLPSQSAWGGTFIVVNAATTDRKAVATYINDIFKIHTEEDKKAIASFTEGKVVVNDKDVMSVCSCSEYASFLGNQNVTEVFCNAANDSYGYMFNLISDLHDATVDNYGTSYNEMMSIYSNILKNYGVDGVFSDTSDIVISEPSSAFTDPLFRAYIMDTFDINNDNKLSELELALVRTISITDYSVPTNILDDEGLNTLKDIYSFDGIDEFNNLETFEVFGFYRGTKIDFSSNTKLKSITLTGAENLESVDISYNTELEKFVHCSAWVGDEEKPVQPITVYAYSSAIVDFASSLSVYDGGDVLISQNEEGDYLLDIPTGTMFKYGSGDTDIVDFTEGKVIIWGETSYPVYDLFRRTDVKFAYFVKQSFIDDNGNYLSFDNGITSTILSGASEPDMVIYYSDYGFDIPNSGAVYTLDELGITADEYSHRYDGSVDLTRNKDGKVCGIQMDASAGVFIYNTGLLKQYTGSAEWNCETWEDVIKLAEKVNTASNGEVKLFAGAGRILQAYGEKPMSTWMNGEDKVVLSKLLDYYLSFAETFAGTELTHGFTIYSQEFSEVFSENKAIAIYGSLEEGTYLTNFIPEGTAMSISIAPSTLAMDGTILAVSKNASDKAAAAEIIRDCLETEDKAVNNFAEPGVINDKNAQLDLELFPTWVGQDDAYEYQAAFELATVSPDEVTDQIISITNRYAIGYCTKEEAEEQIKAVLEEYGYVFADETEVVDPTGNPTPTGNPNPTFEPVKPSIPPITKFPTPTPPREKVTPVPTISISKDTGKKGFVKRLYETCLGRTAEDLGVAYWMTELDKGRSGADVAKQFFFSKEFTDYKLSNKEFVNRMYLTFMDRSADDNGMAYWLTALNNKEKTRADVFNGFVNSQEWANVCNTYGITSGTSIKSNNRLEASDEVIGFSERLYTTCLGRKAEQAGLNFWADSIANRERTGLQASLEFFESKEFKGLNLTDDQFLDRAYATFMDRPADSAGKSYWSKNLKNGTMTRADVVRGFAISPEFNKICEDAGIKAY